MTWMEGMEERTRGFIMKTKFNILNRGVINNKLLITTYSQTSSKFKKMLPSD